MATDGIGDISYHPYRGRCRPTI